MLAFSLLDRMRWKPPSRPMESIFRDNKIGIVYQRLTEERAVFKAGQF